MEMAALGMKGRQAFSSLIPDGRRRLDEIFRACPDLGELAVGVVFGHLHERAVLDPRTREAVALAAITAAGCTGTPLTVHAKVGLASGLTPAEITEVVLVSAAFSGFPRAVEAIDSLARVFDGSGIALPPGPSPRALLINLLDALRAEDAGRVKSLITPDADAGEDLSLVSSWLVGDPDPQVLTLDPHSGIAIIMPTGDSRARHVMYAVTDGSKITQLSVADLT